MGKVGSGEWGVGSGEPRSDPRLGIANGGTDSDKTQKGVLGGAPPRRGGSGQPKVGSEGETSPLKSESGDKNNSTKTQRSTPKSQLPTKGLGRTSILLIAFRSLSRNRTKTILTMLAVAVSVAFYIFLDCLLTGVNIDSQRNIVNYETGAAKLQTKDYIARLDDLPMYDSFGDWKKYGDALEAAGYMYAPRFVFTGTLYTESGSSPMKFIAGDRDDELKVLPYGNYIEAGRFYDNGKVELVLGAQTAEKLQTGIPMRPLESELNAVLDTIPEGDRAWARSLYVDAVKDKSDNAPASGAAPEDKRLMLRLNVSKQDKDKFWAILADTGRMDVTIATAIDIKKTPDADPDKEGSLEHIYQSIDAVVVGTVNSPDPANNISTAYLPMDVLQDESGLMLDGHVTELIIRKANVDGSVLPGKFESPPVITAALEKQFGSPLPDDLTVAGWPVYVPDYLGISTIHNVVFRIISFILFILSFLGIANTMLLAILERTREIGMMRALGMTDAELAQTYLIEAGMLGLIGAFAGVVIGCLINIPMVKYGINVSSIANAAGGNVGYRIENVFRAVWHVPVIIITPILATILAAVSSLIPVRKAVQMEVTDALRFT